MPRTYPVDLEAEGHHVRAVSVTCGLRPVSNLRSESPAYGTHIEIPAMIELLDLIISGVVTAEEVRNDLDGLASELNQDQDSEDDRLLQEFNEAQASGRQKDQIQQVDSRWVYAVSSEDNPKVIKIGVASNVASRIRGLQVSSPSKIHLRWSARGGLPLEGHLHGTFQKRRLSGEWFDFRTVSDPVNVIADAAQTFVAKPE